MPFPEEDVEGVAILLSVMSGVVLLYKGFTMTECGNRLIDHAVQWFKAVYIGYLMISMNLLYIPITKQCFTVWNCVPRTCEAGQWYPEASPSSRLDAMLSAATVTTDVAVLDRMAAMSGECEPCDFTLDAHSCPASEINRLCPGSQTLRLRDSLDLDCEKEVWPFYGTASVLMLICFTFGVPLMYYEIIKQHTKRYASLPVRDRADAAAAHRQSAMQAKQEEADARSGHVPAFGAGNQTKGMAGMKRRQLEDREQMTAEERDEEWARRVKPSRKNRAKNLYADFEFRWRFWKIVLLIQKLLLVVIVMFTVDYPAVCATLMCLNHALMCLFTLYAMPYMDKRPDLLAISISFANFFNTLLAAMAFAQIVVPEGIWWGVMFVNLPLPILMFLTGWWLNVRQRRRKKKADAEKYASVGGGAYSYAMPGSKLPKEAGGGRAVEPEAVAAARRRVERSINEYTLRFLVSWTAVVVVCSCLAGGVISIGSFAKQVTTPVRPHFTVADIPSTVVDCAKEEFATEAEFIGFNTWDNFTDHCCCMARPNPNASDANASDADLEGLVELWACAIDEPDPSLVNDPTPMENRNRTKITYKERVRRNATHDGTFVRPFCASEFDAGNVSLGAPPIYIAPYWNGTMYGVLLGEADNVSFVAELW